MIRPPRHLLTAGAWLLACVLALVIGALTEPAWARYLCLIAAAAARTGHIIP